MKVQNQQQQQQQTKFTCKPTLGIDEVILCWMLTLQLEVDNSAHFSCKFCKENKTKQNKTNLKNEMRHFSIELLILVNG